MPLAIVASERHLLGLSIGLWICVEGQDWAMIWLGKKVGLVLQKREEAEMPRVGAAGLPPSFTPASVGNPGAWGGAREGTAHVPRVRGI